jgi:hypothetical protein
MDINADSVKLTKIPITVKAALGEYPLVEQDLTLTVERILDHMVFSLRSHMLAEELENRSKVVEFTFEFPSSWWQHFKLQVFPKWLQRRFPIKYAHYKYNKKVIFKKYAAYPKANIAIPDKVGELVVYKTFINEV